MIRILSHGDVGGKARCGKIDKEEEEDPNPVVLLKTPKGAGEGCFRGLNEVSLALVGVDLPGLIPILVYEIWNCKNFLQYFTDGHVKKR